ncbi:hypothetical protein GALMADRAFT_256750 [Galerina marginata CBS 339.88]|uniref:Uncharacterized protein n=1 Tax=Galerina marginata (strain CBS 339.88) TaxID=685588 RepID=A0A067SEV5_GALM3|nr:hypothetical protein GALMADRAFT_256750 [Galerina marginata CBS 339.88]
MIFDYSPISKLHAELLLSIFHMNTLTDVVNAESDAAWFSDVSPKMQDRPLTIVRRSSQVCRKWRGVILESSSLWGKVVDMSLLCGLARGHWLNEVIRRSGQQFLHVTTDNAGVSSRLPALIVLLDDHWERIRSLNVTMVVGYSAGMLVREEVSRILRRPTEVLQSFRVEIKIDGLQIANFLVDVPLFANSAPCLTAFSSGHLFLGQHTPNSWLSQLQTLFLSSGLPTYTLQQILQALEGMPGLVTFTITGHSVHPVTSNAHKVVSLPNLKFLRILSGQIVTVTAILDNLVVPAGCTLVAIATQGDQFDEEEELDPRAYQSFRHYSQNYFQVYTSTSLALSITPRTFRFSDTTPHPPRRS